MWTPDTILAVLPRVEASGWASCRSTSKENEREWASSCVHNQKTTKTERCYKMSIQLYGHVDLRVDVRRSQRVRYKVMRIFVAVVRIRSHELDFYSRFCFCWGWGGGGDREKKGAFIKARLHISYFCKNVMLWLLVYRSFGNSCVARGANDIMRA